MNDTNGQVSLLNATGQIVFKSSSVSSTGINIRNLPVGIYAVRITEIGGEVHHDKVVVILDNHLV